MSTSLSGTPGTESTLVARLRSAGCVFAEDEARLLFDAARSADELGAMVERRVGGTPLEYILGWAEFAGRQVAVEAGVFVPRRRSEFLVRQAVARLRSRPSPVVLDLCCGSGALGAAVATALADVGDPVELHAADVDPVAVRCARRNVEPLGGRVYTGDLFEPIPAHLRGSVDAILANAPYVPTDAIALMPPEARVHEPRIALDGGADGLDILRRVAAGAADWLATGGHLLVETSQAQAPRIAATFAGCHLEAEILSSEELGATVVAGSP